MFSLKPALGLVALLPLIHLATAQSQEWGQCGGIGWTGPTTCGACLAMCFRLSVLMCAYSCRYDVRGAERLLLAVSSWIRVDDRAHHDRTNDDAQWSNLHH